MGLRDSYHLVGSFCDWSLSPEPMALTPAADGTVHQIFVVRDGSCSSNSSSSCLVAAEAEDCSAEASENGTEAAKEGVGPAESPTRVDAGPAESLARSFGRSPKKRKLRREEFQIVISKSWVRRVYPGDGHGSVMLRPDIPSVAASEAGKGHDCNWIIEGFPGDIFRITFDPSSMIVSSAFVENRLNGSQSARWRGVNLGCWLVLEKWMAPEFFAGLAPTAEDELALMTQGGSKARTAVKEFRDSFIRLEDFEWLASTGGINAVRLPVGFWCLEEHARGTPFLPTCEYVDLAFDWAEANGLQILLELHGAVGSQNVEHHSGCSGCGVAWLEGSKRRQNLQVLEAWAIRWGHRKAFLGLGLGNEVAKPKPSSSSWKSDFVGTLLCKRCRGIQPRGYWEEVADFYAQAGRLVRPHLRPDTPLVIDTCWDTSRFLQGRLAKVPGPLWLDYHHYECMGSGDPGTVEDHIKAVNLCNQLLLEFPPNGQQPPPSFVLGEFSLALKPQSQGYDADGWQSRFFRNQTQLAAQRAVGWFFWSYKMARAGWSHWSYRESVELGWISPAS